MKTSTISAALVTLLASPGGWGEWGPGTAFGQPSEGLAPYFGFGDARIVVVDEECGPVAVADFNADGRPDLAVANNRKSRVEIHYLRDAARTVEETQRVLKANELPPAPWYDTVKISVGHRVGAIAAVDVDGDKKTDLIYAGSEPSEIVVLRQVEASKFEVLAKQRVRELSSADDALVVADVQGDAAPEVVAVAGGKVNVFPLAKSGRLAEPVVLGSGGEIRRLRIADFSADGRADVLATVPDDASPLRLWVQSEDARLPGKPGFLAAELRFEMPALMDAAVLPFPKAAGGAASIAVIERVSRRIVFYDLAGRPVAAPTGPAAEREVRAAVTSFADAGAKGRSVALADFDADGMTDLVTTDQKSNALVLYRQQRGLGLSRAEPFSAFKAPKMIDAGRWTDSPDPKVFVLSEQEKAVGMAAVDPKTGSIGFPRPLALVTPGATPVAIAYFEAGGAGGGGGGAPVLVVLSKAQRDYTLELHQDSARDGLAQGELQEATTIAVKDLKRDPSTILPFDADRDGVLDLLLLTPGEAMTLVRCEMKGDLEKPPQIAPAQVLNKDQMLQFGLVQAAGPDNTARLDMDGDGRDELLIADANYVRACAYDGKAGWRVVSQVNVPDATTQFVGLALLRGADPAATRIIAADKGGGRLVTFAREVEAGRGAAAWTIADRIRLQGFAVGPIRAGAFGGDAEPSILCLSDDAFALVRLAGRRPALEEFAAFRSESEDRQEHRLAAGDLNADGFLDVVSLDAREQMCQILTFSASRKPYLATEFEVFQTRQFRGGDPREFEPRDATVTDLTGDGRADLLLTVHDRLIIYPQASQKP